ncbi:MAG TPA: glycosyltransferase family 4 protein [Pyrinomonadaceae bacterium]|nr:glycosyltransferase family 4 protein [Pyrinomonadaceae bacterium]
MRILIATVQVPFIRGGAEIHAEGLRDALRAGGHETEIVAIPFKWYPPEQILDHMLACRLLDLTATAGTPVDMLIGLKFPAYLISHPNKVLWILHQHRTAYELWDHPLSDLIYYPNGAQVRDAIQQADRNLLPQARAIFANSRNVANRLKRFCGIDSTPLYHPPPHAESFYCAAAEDYIFFPSRLCIPKRQAMVLEALGQTRNPVRVRFAGSPDRPSYREEIKTIARKFSLGNRVEWLENAPDEQIRQLYAHSLGVVYPPTDEDYGYVTLEAMLSAKPVITCTDSGGPLEFVINEKTGLIAEPNSKALAAALDTLWENPVEARIWGEAGRSHYNSFDINWENVVRKLLA